MCNCIDNNQGPLEINVCVIMFPIALLLYGINYKLSVNEGVLKMKEIHHKAICIEIKVMIKILKVSNELFSEFTQFKNPIRLSS